MPYDFACKKHNTIASVLPFYVWESITWYNEYFKLFRGKTHKECKETTSLGSARLLTRPSIFYINLWYLAFRSSSLIMFLSILDTYARKLYARYWSHFFSSKVRSPVLHVLLISLKSSFWISFQSYNWILSIPVALFGKNEDSFYSFIYFLRIYAYLHHFKFIIVCLALFLHNLNEQLTRFFSSLLSDVY